MFEPTDVARKMLCLLGRKDNGRINSRYFFLAILSFLILLQILLLILLQWSKPDTRFLAFEDFVVRLNVLSIFIEYAVFPDRSITVMSIIERKLFDVGYRLSNKHDELFNTSRKLTYKTMKMILIPVSIYNLSNCLAPIIVGLLSINSDNFDSNSIKSLPLAFAVWTPFKLTSLYHYYLVLLLESLYIVGEWLIFGCWNLLTIIAYLTVENELKLLSQSINEIDIRLSSGRFGSDNQQYENNGSDRNETITDSQSETVLRTYLKDLVVHHQSVIR